MLTLAHAHTRFSSFWILSMQLEIQTIKNKHMLSDFPMNFPDTECHQVIHRI